MLFVRAAEHVRTSWNFGYIRPAQLYQKEDALSKLRLHSREQENARDAARKREYRQGVEWWRLVYNLNFPLITTKTNIAKLENTTPDSTPCCAAAALFHGDEEFWNAAALGAPVAVGWSHS